MYRRRWVPLHLAAALAALLGLLPTRAIGEAAAVPGELLVGLRPGGGRAAFLAVGAIAGETVEYIRELDVVRVRVRPGLQMAQAAARMRTRSDVLFVEPNGLYETCAAPNDPAYASEQYGPQQVGVDRAWEIWRPTYPVIVAIVDTGINVAHPDLAGKVVPGYNTLKRTTSAADDKGHGSHCAGIAAAQVNNGAGIAGIAGWDGGPGSDTTFTKLMPVKVLNKQGAGSDASVSAGITWAADAGAKVINLSLSGSGSNTLKKAVAYAWERGCVVVAASGNSGSKNLRYPAAYPNVISVAATDVNNALTTYSNWGTWVSVAAPGEQVYSASLAGYARLSGTSMAAALVSGEVALIRAQNPGLTNAQVRALVTAHTEPCTLPEGRSLGGGRVDVYAALAAAGHGSAPAEPARPGALAATAASKSRIDLAWLDNSANETGFAVDRSTDGTTFTQVATLPANTVAYASTGLSRGKPYWYRVRAFNAAGSSAYSNIANATTLKR